MKIAVVGGHMAPALGFIDSLPKEATVVYIGREHVFEGDAGSSLEQKTVVEKGIRFVAFKTGRIQRMLTPHTLPSLFAVPRGFTRALTLLKKEKPDVVVGFGGYLSVPLGIAARILGIPLIIHESTLEAGLANKILIPFAQKICISWDSSRQFFPANKTVLTGNPLLPLATKKHLDVLPKNSNKLPLIVVSGGSGGSHIVNLSILQILPELVEIANVVHQTGDAKEFGDYENLLSKKRTLPEKLRTHYSVVKFIDPQEINSVFAKADLVIGRSGINTVGALMLLRKKAILIPLPTGQKDEQLKNAKLLESEYGAVIIEQRHLSPKVLFKTIRDELNRKIVQAAKWQIPVIKNGAENLVREVISCIQSHNEK